MPSMKAITVLTILFASFYYAVTAATLFRKGNGSNAVSKMRKTDWVSHEDGDVPDDEIIPASNEFGLSVFNSLAALKENLRNVKDKCIWTADSTEFATGPVSVGTAGSNGHISLHPKGGDTAKDLKMFLNSKFTKHTKRQLLRWERSEVAMLEEHDDGLC
ncbi:hypothetical protein BT96DRAFT_977131 [Gymnopus androsaceus JB14]|uniref:Uncharacterized protein n=1 Tax=Gymnopus androsaceus JB14 TaxID=1447944 RepID=A0A6A4HFA2_9AGAR|nr:hypothetical protein BT96DRAFT_977131 [Gymnopus androsaceus JB14]